MKMLNMAAPATEAPPAGIPYRWQARAGEVWLVGAGTGDPGLLTLKGWSLLRSADVVVHDRLGSEEILQLLPAGIRRVDVGKGPGSAPVSQEEIGRILEREARDGNAVVRLKGGDPFVFGRGMEEWVHLHQAGIPCRVVPGVSSCIAGPESAGIPVTHRGIARHFLVSTAHTEEGALPNFGEADTHVFLMGVGSIGRITAALLERGLAPETPAAVVSNASTYRQESIRGTLESIAAGVETAGIGSPAVLVIGNTAALGAEAGRREGRAIVVTSTLVPALLETLRPGIAVVWRPLFEPAPLADAEVAARHTELLGALGADWLLFNSPPAVREFFALLPRLGVDARRLSARLAVVGEEAAAALQAQGMVADLVVAGGRAAASASLAAAISPAARVMFPCNECYSGGLIRSLAAAGLPQVRPLAVWRQQNRTPAQVSWRHVAEVYFASPRAVRRFQEEFPEAPTTGLRALAMGETTTRAAVQAGFGQVEDLAAGHSAEALEEAL